MLTNLSNFSPFAADVCVSCGVQIYEKLSKESSRKDLKLYAACCYFMLGKYKEAFDEASECIFFDFFVFKKIIYGILLAKVVSLY